MGSKYDQLLKTPPNEKECVIEGLSVADKQIDKSNSFENDITTNPMRSKDKPFTVFMYHQNVHLVLLMYLRYINHFVAKKLNESFQCDWLDKNLGFVISAEKMLLDEVFGSKKYFEEIFSESGMLQDIDQCRKARIVTREEGILPIIQQSLALSFPLRSYSAIVQLHTEYIQITLHQVVKIREPSGDLKYVKVGDKKVLLKNVSDIIVRDKIIPTQNANDSICINILNHIERYGVIDRCKSHKNGGDPSNILYLLKDYKSGFKKLKQQIVDIVLSLQQKNLSDIDKQQKISFGHKCNCFFSLSPRDIIDVGFKPTLQKIATTIVASLMNTSLFGDYGVDFVFIFGDLYDLTSDSMLHKIYTNILQQAIIASIQTKQVRTRGFVFRESFSQLSHGITHEQLPFMGDCLTIGKLHQACSETYAIYVGALNEPFAREHNLFCEDYKYDNENAVLRKKFAMVILQKGQPIPITGCVKKFKMNFEDEDENGYNYEVLELGNN
ncbi:uncharacterized protein EV154DRAFT_234808 [Mucor mucedo]|uniref:uncharacterized protein n=1 Tax=Mucor mucedo TaxID=29922 RepID=UPI00221EE029|nr:uncharacterized protein EV154DRAFT_234808 [Mucor mucedo]KAI7890893.1 hypothetical protein EV154DRAFT_234808 [Mucor mucedo]